MPTLESKQTDGQKPESVDTRLRLCKFLDSTVGIPATDFDGRFRFYVINAVPVVPRFSL